MSTPLSNALEIPQPGLLGRLLRHASNYSAGSLLITMASVITFPIFTRIFTIEQYGTLGLVNATLLLLVGIGKFGIQNSVIRFYAEVETGKRDTDTTSFFSTALFGMAALGVGASVLCAIAAVALPDSVWGKTSTGPLLLLASPLVLVRVLDSGLLNLIRAQQRSAFYSLYTVVRKYVGVGAILLALFLVARSLESFFVSTMITEALAVAYLLVSYARRGLIDIRRFSRPLLIAMLAFGLPLLGSELSMIILSIGGRYIVNDELGARALGAYSAAYNLCDYVQAVLTMAFGQALVPMYTSLWESSGRESTTEFLQKSLRYYLAFALPVLAGMMAVGPELLRLLASNKYNEGATLIPYVIGGMLVTGGAPIFCAGIYIKKQTEVVLYSVIAAAIVNLALTIVLSRAFGIAGAGMATLASYLLYSASTGYFSYRTISIRFPWADAAKFSALATLMYFAVKDINIQPLALKLSVQVIAGIFIYAGLVILGDRTIRDVAVKYTGPVLSRLSRGTASRAPTRTNNGHTNDDRANEAPVQPSMGNLMREFMQSLRHVVKTRLVQPIHVAALLSGTSLRLAKRQPERRILMLHNIPYFDDRNNPFEARMLWLKRHFQLVSLPSMIDRIERDVPPSPGGELALTFDDGLRNQGEHAYKFLLKHRIPATIFVCPGLIENRTWLWNQEARLRLHTLTKRRQRQLALDIGAPSAKVEPIIAWMKTLFLQNRQAVEAAIRAATPAFIPSAELRAIYDPLTWDTIRALDSEVITIGSHTLTHPILSILDDAQLVHEIAHSRLLLEDRLNRPIDLFCYPNGSHDPRARRLVADHYRAAVTTEDGFVRPGAQLEILPRIPFSFSASMLAWRLHRPGA